MRNAKYQLPGLSVIYEDNHLIAINKPAGSLVHGDDTGDETLADLVKQYIKIRYEKPGDVFLGVIHRLDRPVSGVVIFARTSKALVRMNKMLQEKSIEKTYLAIVAKRPEDLSGRLVHYIIKDESKNIVRAYNSKKSGAKEAILEYNLVGELDAKIMLEVKPLTGRPHQIRAQLSKIECPIIGDLKYGAEYALVDKSIALHCRKMTFEHPVKNEQVTIMAEKPKIFPWNTFNYG
jgi:23S rRNA pseudouridine1911/1915/1917 synthase